MINIETIIWKEIESEKVLHLKNKKGLQEKINKFKSLDAIGITIPVA